MRRLDEVAAKQEISEVIVAYANGIDRRDWDLFRSCFTADCLAEYEGVGTWDDVDAFTAFMVGAHDTMGHTLHRLSNITIAVDGDAAVARTYVDAVLMAPDGASGLNAVGFYDDQLVRIDTGWRIAHRRYTPVHYAVLAAP